MNTSGSHGRIRLITALALVIKLHVFFFFFFLPTVYAATFRLEPARYTARVGENFSTQVIVDTKGANTHSADAKLIYDPAVVTVVGIAPGSFYDKHLQRFKDANIYLSGGNDAGTRTGSGVLGTITFRALTMGVTSLRFACTGNGFSDFTNIENEERDDIVDCSTLQSSIYSISSIAMPASSSSAISPAADVTVVFHSPLQLSSGQVTETNSQQEVIIQTSSVPITTPTPVIDSQSLGKTLGTHTEKNNTLPWIALLTVGGIVFFTIGLFFVVS